MPKHSQIIAALLLGLACFLVHYGYTEQHSYAGRLMQALTGQVSPLVLQYYLGAGISLVLAIFWSLK